MIHFNKFAKELNKQYNFDIKYKDESVLMKIISFILFMNPGFMTQYITTIGNKIYFPSRGYIERNDSSAIKVLAHEVVHISQGKKYTNLLFGIMYLFPQCLCVLSVLAFFNLWFLLFLVFLLPFPAPWRKAFEFEGYSMSLFMSYLWLKSVGHREDYIDSRLRFLANYYNEQFIKSYYWFMWPFGVKEKFYNKIDEIKKGDISDTDEVYGHVERAYKATFSSG